MESIFLKKPDICCQDIWIRYGILLMKQPKQKSRQNRLLISLKTFSIPRSFTACDTLRIPLVQKSYWPDNKSFAVCLTHDVDELKKTYQYITRPVIYMLKRDIQGLKGQLNSFCKKSKGMSLTGHLKIFLQSKKNFRQNPPILFLKKVVKPRSLFQKNMVCLREKP